LARRNDREAFEIVVRANTVQAALDAQAHPNQKSAKHQ
jgi:hypothetical protein